MTAPHPPAAPRPRTRSAEDRRRQLIESTIETIAQRGYSRTTLTAVAQTAGLSHGLILFHFKTKDQLLAETLDYLSQEYRENWQAALAAAGPDPQHRIAALVEADFNPAICTKSRLAAWCAFWGESQGRPLYQARCADNDAIYNATFEALFAAMNARHGYGHDPARASRIVRVLVEGTWLEQFTMQAPYSLAEARATIWTALAALFPRHFTPEGMSGPPRAR